MNNYNNSRRIKILRDTVALRIAAGEVIDRPFSVVRELMDNAVDSGADRIDVYVYGGGIDRIRVVDNGSGMSAEDIRKCYLPHATSKLSELEDLDSIRTLGFRGEALASIGACARMEIISSETGEEANRIVVSDGKLLDFSPYKGNKGTVADVSGLFNSIPARKKFLKRPSSEAAACRKMFIDKALPFSHINFRYFQDGELKIFLNGSTLKERVLNTYSSILNKDLTREMETVKSNYSIRIIASDPSLNRKDRRYIQIFVNNRRITDFSLVQAAEYGFAEFLPGGTYPIAFIFLDIDPALIDVNIHPAKREIRIRNISEIHHEIVTLIKNFLEGFTYNYSRSFEKSPAARDFTAFNDLPPSRTVEKDYPAPIITKDYLSEKRKEYIKQAEIPEDSINFKYLGQAFNLFLIIEADHNIYFIDQHASHEKILFNKFINGNSAVQELLVPMVFSLEEESGLELSKRMEELSGMGIIVEKLGNGRWALKGIPSNSTGLENLIVDFLKETKGTVKDLKTALYADMACKSAVKDGEILDPVTAVELIKETLKLENARCPHGRPLWFQISREELFKLVGRT